MINKALLYKEWKRFGWLIMILLIVTLLCKVVIPYFNIITYKTYFENDINFNNEQFSHDFAWTVLDNNDVSTIFTLILIFIMAIMLYSDLRGNNYSLMSSMPFTRKEIIINKLFIGFAAIIGTYFISFVFISFMYLANIKIVHCYIKYSAILQWFFMNIFTYCAVFSFIMMVQSCMGSMIAGGIVSAILIILPLSFCVMFGELISHFARILDVNRKLIQRKIYFIYQMGGNITFSIYNLTDVHFHNDVFTFSNFTLKFIVLVVLTIIFSALTMYIYNKNSLEKNQKFIGFRSLEKVFMIGFSICLVLVVNVFCHDILNIAILCLILLLAGVAGYFISKKICKSWHMI